MELTLRLVGETPIGELVSTAKSLAERLRGEPIEFVEVRRATSADRNYAGELFDAVWRGPGVELSAGIANGSDGNPRDGWGYDIELALRIEPGGALAESISITLRDGSMSQSVWSPTLGIRCTTVAVFDRARAIVCELLPGRRDETDVPPWSTYNADALLKEGNERDARLFVERCWAIESGRPHEGAEQSYWSTFLALRARLEPQSPESRGRRLREDPGALDEWCAIARGEATADGFSRTTASWCAALLAPYRPSLVSGLSKGSHAERLRRAIAAMIATPAWFATSTEDIDARRSGTLATDGSDGAWFRVTDDTRDQADAASIGGHASRAMFAASPLRGASIEAHRIDGALAEAPLEGHGELRLAFEPRPGTFRAEWNAAWAKGGGGDEVPVVWVDLCWTLNTRNTLYRWHWVWTDSPVRGVCFVETRRAREGARQLDLPADHPIQGGTGWIRGETFMHVIGDSPWRDRVIETLAAVPFVTLQCEPVDASHVHW